MFEFIFECVMRAILEAKTEFRYVIQLNRTITLDYILATITHIPSKIDSIL